MGFTVRPRRLGSGPNRRARLAPALAAGVSVLAILTACGGRAEPTKLTWHTCGDDMECSTLTVPLDHTRPQGEQLELSLTRLPAGGDRIGSLVVNPGGPGVSGLDYARAARSIVSEPVLERFDIVGFDPRGVGRSSPVHCLDDAGLDTFLALDTTPDTADEQDALVSASRDFAAACQAHSAKLLPHIGTIDVARDLDLLRDALGDPQLTYLGKSYGTLLGATYAELFPARVRALVLDGALDPALPRLTLNTEQALAFDTAFRSYLRYCLADSDCPFSSRTISGAAQELAALLRRTDTAPLHAARPVTESLATLGALTPLYDRSGWPILTAALRQARTGDGTLLLQQSDHLVGRLANGTYSNQTAANVAINCIDAPYPRDPQTYAQAAQAADRISPAFGSYLTWSSLPCAFWPAAPSKPRPLRAAGAAPILVIGTTRDPATPYSWAESLAGQLESGVLLGFDSDGHTAYFNGSGCVDEVVDRYLVTGVVPGEEVVCPDIR
ncbi:alpha/beta hydrolase [Nonomuraea soli]|uniref:Pimeloyl-ACP methyl ester carboxylesterase n=1 Tax=Nonomuraea soli TaxID=1032476 RepID=A0A7W0CJ00_9ACTN|nr:alpha/beta hydrolase [Nonomuraea soli]MBA2892092.1 pimeloyl-ACP methyl ester carboxylesterase [Nonomuraea soli]